MSTVLRLAENPSDPIALSIVEAIERGESLIVMKGEATIGSLEAKARPPAELKIWRGMLKGKTGVADDFDHPLQDWEEV